MSLPLQQLLPCRFNNAVVAVAMAKEGLAGPSKKTA
jgi:hypothetical protein